MADITVVNTPAAVPTPIEGAPTPAPLKLAPPEPALAPAQKPPAESAEPYFDLIELLFFAYRDFVGDPDEVLEKLGFGRAHHRVLHFVNRNPGMKVAELLDVLKITKQSLGRVLKQLIDEGYVVQKAGANDRRQRLLYASPAGEALATKLAGLQARRIKRVLADLGPETRETARRFLAGMIDASDRERVLRLIARADSFTGCAEGKAQNEVAQKNALQGEAS